MSDRQDSPIPEKWTTAKLEEVAVVLDNFREPVNSKERQKRIEGKSQETLFPYYGATGKVGYIDNYLLEGEYVLLGEDGAPFLDFAKDTAYLVRGKIWVNNHAHILQSLTSNKYLCYFLNQVDYRNYVTGTTRLKLNQSAMRQIPVKVPPLAEQQRIVDKIEELFSDLDSGVNSLKTAQQQLKVYRQAVLKWAFEGKLTAQWREEQQRQGKLESADTLLAQIKAERERRYQEKLEVWQAEVEAWEVSGQDGKKLRKPKKPKDLDPINSQELAELASLPQSWQWERLGNLADIVGGVTKGRNLDDKSTISLPYLRVANVQDGYLDLEQIKHIDVLKEDLEKYRLEYGDILYTEGGDRDKLGRGTIWKDEIENCIHQNHVFRARLFSDSINNSFIAYFSRTTLAKDYFFKRAKQTVNLASINMTILSNFPLPISSTKEQIQILDEIESRFSICDQIEADIKANLKKAEVLRQSILKDAFEGQLVPQNPNDEPASVLLERINQEKRKRIEEWEETRKARKQQSSKQKNREKMATLRDVLESKNSWVSAQELFRQCGIGDNSATDTIENLYLELRDFIKDGEVEVVRRDDEDWLRLVLMEEK